MTAMLLKTEAAKTREKRDLALYTDWVNLLSVEGQSKTEVIKYLMNKYGVHSPMTVRVIVKRVESRLADMKK